MESVLSSYLPAPVLIAVVCTVLGSELIKKLDRRDMFKGYKILFPALWAGIMSTLLAFGGFIPADQVFFWDAVIFMLAVSGYELIAKRFLHHEKDS